MIMRDLSEHVFKSVRNLRYFDDNAYSKNSNNDNNVLTDSISSKYQGDYYFESHMQGQHSNLARRATQSYVVQLRRATLCSAELR